MSAAEKARLDRLASGKISAVLQQVTKLTGRNNFLEFKKSIEDVAYTREWHADTLKLGRDTQEEKALEWNGVEEQDEYVRLSRREAFVVLTSCLTDKTKHHKTAVRAGDARGLWSKLHKSYLRKAFGSRSKGISQFLQMTMENTGLAIEPYVSHITLKANELKDKGGSVDNDSKKHVLVNGLLLPEFQAKQEAIWADADTDALTFDELADRVVDFAEQKDLIEVCRGAPTTNYNHGQDRRASILCRYWRQKGFCLKHEQHKCPFNHDESKRGKKGGRGRDDDDDDDDNNKFRGKCFACEGKHRVSDCPLIAKAKKMLQDKDADKDDDKKAINNLMRMLQEKTTTDDAKDIAGNFVMQAKEADDAGGPPTQIHTDTHMFVMKLDHTNKSNFANDCGTNRHIFNDKKYFKQGTLKTCNVDVLDGNGKTRKIKWMGDVECISILPDGIRRLTLKNALLSENCPKCLISETIFVKKGCMTVKLGKSMAVVDIKGKLLVTGDLRDDDLFYLQLFPVTSNTRMAAQTHAHQQDSDAEKCQNFFMTGTSPKLHTKRTNDVISEYQVGNSKIVATDRYEAYQPSAPGDPASGFSKNGGPMADADDQGERCSTTSNTAPQQKPTTATDSDDDGKETYRTVFDDVDNPLCCNANNSTHVFYVQNDECGGHQEQKSDTTGSPVTAATAAKALEVLTNFAASTTDEEISDDGEQLERFVLLTMTKGGLLGASMRAHYKHGHIEQHLANKLEGLPPLAYKFPCLACELAKAKRQPIKTTSLLRANHSGQSLHADIGGSVGGGVPVSTTGQKYYLCVVDDKSRYGIVVFLTSKDHAIQRLQEVVKKINNEKFPVQVSLVRTDGDSVFAAENMQQFFKERGIQHNVSASNRQAQNGVVERRIGVLEAMARAMMKHAGSPTSDFFYAVQHANYLVNRTPTKACDGERPFDVWRGLKDDPNELPLRGIFGSFCTARIYQHGKLDDRARCCTYLGRDEEH